MEAVGLGNFLRFWENPEWATLVRFLKKRTIRKSAPARKGIFKKQTNPVIPREIES
jgi:hypothetical protein